MKQTIFALLCTLGLLLSSCQKEESNTPPPAERTLMIYMLGTQLSGYFNENIAQLKQAAGLGALGNNRVLIFHQRQYDQAEILEITAEEPTGGTQILKSYSQINTTDPNAVRQIFKDMAALAPAPTYGLVVGCHGLGWIPSSVPTDMFARGRMIGDSGHYMEIPKLAEALTGLPFHLDYLLFDACFMSNIETIYDLRNCADCIVGAPCEVLASGMPYHQIIAPLLSNNIDAVCSAFHNYYWQKSGCIAKTNCHEIEALAKIMLRINSSITKSYDRTQLQTYEGLSTHLFFDLGHYVETICADQSLLADFHAQFDRTFPPAARLYTPLFRSNLGHVGDYQITHYSGVTFSEPTANTVALEHNQLTAWYRATHK